MTTRPDIEAVAEALYRQDRTEEWEGEPAGPGVPKPDLETYLEWFSWDNLGSQQDVWRRRAAVAIDALVAQQNQAFDERMEIARNASGVDL